MRYLKIVGYEPHSFDVSEDVGGILQQEDEDYHTEFGGTNFDFDWRCAPPCRFLILVLLFRFTPFPNLYIGVSTLTRRYGLDVTADCAGNLRATTASLILDHLEIVRQQSVTCDRAIVGNAGEGTDNARSNEDGEVEAVLRVPLRC